VPTSTPGRILTTLRFVIGSGPWVAPRLSGRLFGLDPDGNPQLTYMARLFGVRNLVLGCTLASTEGDTRRLWWQVGVAVDAVDAVASVLAMRKAEVSPGTGALLTATALCAAGLGSAALAADDV
jgi:hypothetical protein